MLVHHVDESSGELVLVMQFDGRTIKMAIDLITLAITHCSHQAANSFGQSVTSSSWLAGLV